MENHNDHNHSNEQKPVSFTVPFILAAVTLTIIFLLVSLGDPCHSECVCDKDCSKECIEACEKGDHSKHPETKGHEAHSGATSAGENAKDEKSESAVETQEAVTPTDSSKTKEAAHH